VKDAIRAYHQADALAATLAEEAAARVRQAQLLLGDLLEQDLEVQHPKSGKPQVAVKQGTAPDRIPSATDPEQRHGHKSKEKKFTGHKARTVVDTESGLILDTQVLPGNAGDASEVKAQIERVAQENDVTIAAVLGDCAFGNGATRAEFAETEITLHAKVPAEARRGELFLKSRFTLDLEAGTATCPAGKTTSDYLETDGGGRVYRFGTQCAGCPLRAQCTQSPHGRTVAQHPQEALLRAARAEAATPAGRQTLRERVIVEHRQARLAQLGAKQARYFGRKKTEFQALLAATVANLRLIWNRAQAQAAAGGGNGPVNPENLGVPGPFGFWRCLIRRFEAPLDAYRPILPSVPPRDPLRRIWVQ
jgi:hypothetical protein